MRALLPAGQQTCQTFPAHHKHKPQEGSYWSDGLGRQQVDINIDWRPGSLAGILLAAPDIIFLDLASHRSALVVINMHLPTTGLKGPPYKQNIPDVLSSQLLSSI